MLSFSQLLLITYMVLMLIVPNFILSLIIILPVIFIKHLGVKKKIKKRTLIFTGLSLILLAYLLLINFSYPQIMLESNLTMLLIFTTSYLLVFILLEKEDSEKKIQMFKEVLFYLGSLLAVYGVFIYFFGTTSGTYQVFKLGPINLKQSIMGQEPLLRITSLTKNPNSLAMILNFSILSGLSLIKTNKSLKLKVLLIIQVIALILTYSKTGIIVTIILMLLVVYSSNLRRLTKIIIYLVLLTIVIISSNKIDQLDTNRFDVDLNNREVAWKIAEEKVINNPFQPIGFPNSGYYLEELNDIDNKMHNSYIMLALEIGLIPTLILYSTWIILIINLLINQKNKKNTYLILMNVILLIQQLTEAKMFRYDLVHFIGISIITFSVLMLYRKEE